jgi:hypothetical protein
MTITMPDRAEHHPVTARPAAELERIVHAASERPCAAPAARAEDWFPEEPGPGYQRRARARYEARALALCRGCPVAIECLELAILREGPARGHGISGATAPWQRQRIKRSRGLAAHRG